MEEENERMHNLSNTFIEEYKCKELQINIEEKLEPGRQCCCIYRVPTLLRSVNEKVYTPQTISIGPFHHGEEKLANMEKQKVRYKRSFGERITPENWEDFLSFIKDNEQHIRNCYSESFSLKSFQFITMILYDVVFIIELLLRYHEKKYDFLLHIPSIRAGIWLDLQLLENQLPYFVLEELYKLVEHNGKNNYPNLFVLSCQFFRDSMFQEDPYQTNIKHFVDLRRCALVKSYPEANTKRKIMDLPCAVKLNESAVKFKNIGNNCLLNIKFEKGKWRIPCLKVDELQIPSIQIHDQTECLFRNMMALEQCHYQQETHVCNYIVLMDFLINTEKDVELLAEKGIISNFVGEYDTIAKMFNQLCLQIETSDSHYYGIVEDLKAHYNNSWNRKYATLKSVYFSNPWKGTGTIAAIILLLLTLMQTICSFLQVVY